MVDSLTKSERSERMRRIRNRDTRPERTLRSALHAKGLRFRLHRNDLPGRPDIVLPRFCTVIFVHGCFWHRHQGCSICTTPKSNTQFWQGKFDRNIVRDRRNVRQLRKLGWAVFTVWECELSSPLKVERIAERVARRLRAR
ncbi:very short patch repair endonuclease [Ramlibacter sp. PS4R-6]|uniref:very short patch repair endonuclease n=1 Tax=Ramlibacter sp. PS4R-6 TaxID=3133438 RepID=UPI0030967F14